MSRWRQDGEEARTDGWKKKRQEELHLEREEEKVMEGGEKRAGGELLFRVFESSWSWFEA